MQSAKTKITECVKEYIKLMPDEYAAFLTIVADKKSNLIDAKFGLAKDSANEMRALFEMPSTLHDMIIMKLDEEETEWFKAGGANKKAGARWFAENFPAFRLPDSI